MAGFHVGPHVEGLELGHRQRSLLENPGGNHRGGTACGRRSRFPPVKAIEEVAGGGYRPRPHSNRPSPLPGRNPHSDAERIPSADAIWNRVNLQGLTLRPGIIREVSNKLISMSFPIGGLRVLSAELRCGKMLGWWWSQARQSTPYLRPCPRGRGQHRPNFRE